MSLKVDLSHVRGIPIVINNLSHDPTLTIESVDHVRFQNGDISLHFNEYEALTKAHENTGWLPISTGTGERWRGFIFVLFQHQHDLHKLIALVDSRHSKIVLCKDFCVSPTHSNQKMRLRLFNDYTNPAVFNDDKELVIENITFVRCNLGSYYLEFDDVDAFTACQLQTGWETDIEKNFRIYLPQSFTWGSDQSYIRTFLSDVETPYNNFELVPQ